MAFTVTTWTDYLCPWAYLGRRHSQWIRNAGVDVMIRGYELHPDVPPEGRPIRPGGSYDRLLDRLQAESRANGVDFNKPSRTPNTRAALELLELVHHHQPDRALAYDDALAAATWIDGRPIDQADVLRDLATEAGVDDDLVRLLDLGRGSELLEAGRAEAIEFEVSATPSWRIGELTIAGVHEDAQFQRWAGRLIERNSS
ncbi:MAG: DsbA family protein [Acidimicrobiales bacterium]